MLRRWLLVLVLVVAGALGSPAHAQYCSITTASNHVQAGANVNILFSGAGWEVGTYRTIRVIVDFEHGGTTVPCSWINTSGEAWSGGDGDDRDIPVRAFSSNDQHDNATLVLPNMSGCLTIRFISPENTVIPIPFAFFIAVGDSTQATCFTGGAGGGSRVVLTTTVKRAGIPVENVNVQYYQPDHQDANQFGTTDSNGNFAAQVMSDLDWDVFVQYHDPTLGWVNKSKRAFCPKNVGTNVVFDLQDDGSDTGGDPTSGGDSNPLLAGLNSLLKKLFVPSQSKVQSFMDHFSELWNWGPFSLIEQIVALQNVGAGNQEWTMKFPKLKATGIDADDCVTVPINFNMITQNSAWGLMRMVAGVTVYLGFAVFVLKQMMPRQVV